jgi:hypothetical protein
MPKLISIYMPKLISWKTLWMIMAQGIGSSHFSSFLTWVQQQKTAFGYLLFIVFI